jgi:bifunctional DNase/RNase
LRDNTFFATINLKDRAGEAVMIDARPSDAIALALRVDCPIFVNEEVIRASRNTVSSGEEESVSGSEDDWPDVIGEAGDLPM